MDTFSYQKEGDVGSGGGIVVGFYKMSPFALGCFLGRTYEDLLVDVCLFIVSRRWDGATRSVFFLSSIRPLELPASSLSFEFVL